MLEGCVAATSRCVNLMVVHASNAWTSLEAACLDLDSSIPRLDEVMSNTLVQGGVSAESDSGVLVSPERMAFWRFFNAFLWVFCSCLVMMHRKGSVRWSQYSVEFFCLSTSANGRRIVLSVALATLKLWRVRVVSVPSAARCWATAVLYLANASAMSTGNMEIQTNTY